MAKRIVSVKYGCFKNRKPEEDTCVFDNGDHIYNCEEAEKLVRMKRDRGTCRYWRLM